MKKTIINLTVAFLFIFGVSSISNALSVLSVDTANARDYEVSITMEYLDPPADLGGYNIYLNDLLIDTINSTTAVTSWGATVDLNDGNNTFGVTSFDNIGQESPKSEGDNFNPPPKTGPQITEISIVETTPTE